MHSMAPLNSKRHYHFLSHVKP